MQNAKKLWVDFVRYRPDPRGTIQLKSNLIVFLFTLAAFSPMAQASNPFVLLHEIDLKQALSGHLKKHEEIFTHALDMAPDDDTIAVGSTQGNLFLLNSYGVLVKSINVCQRQILQIKFINEVYVAVVTFAMQDSEAPCLHIINYQYGNIVRTMDVNQAVSPRRDNNRGIQSLIVSPQRHIFATIENERQLTIWDASTFTPLNIHYRKKSESRLASFDFTPDGSHIVILEANVSDTDPNQAGEVQVRLVPDGPDDPPQIKWATGNVGADARITASKEKEGRFIIQSREYASGGSKEDAERQIIYDRRYTNDQYYSSRYISLPDQAEAGENLAMSPEGFMALPAKIPKGKYKNDYVVYILRQPFDECIQALGGLRKGVGAIAFVAGGEILLFYSYHDRIEIWGH